MGKGSSNMNAGRGESVEGGGWMCWRRGRICRSRGKPWSFDKNSEFEIFPMPWSTMLHRVVSSGRCIKNQHGTCQCNTEILYVQYIPRNMHTVLLCFALLWLCIHQGCFAGTGAIVRLPQCQWSKPDGYGKISQCITTTKHSKAKPCAYFLGSTVWNDARTVHVVFHSSDTDKWSHTGIPWQLSNVTGHG